MLDVPQRDPRLIHHDDPWMLFRIHTFRKPQHGLPRGISGVGFRKVPVGSGNGDLRQTRPADPEKRCLLIAEQQDRESTVAPPEGCGEGLDGSFRFPVTFDRADIRDDDEGMVH